MNVLFLLTGPRSKASSRVRGYWVAEALAERGVTCTLLHGQSPTFWAKALLAGCRADAVVFQKRYSRWDLLLQRLLQRLGKHTVFDLDDAPSRIDHPVTVRHANAMMAGASVVTVGCRNLRDMSLPFQPRTVLVPSCTRMADYPAQPLHPPTGPVTLGWIGNGAHYAPDLLQVLVPALTRVAAATPLHLSLIGASGQAELHAAFAAIKGLTTSLTDSIDWAAPGATARALAEVDIGLYPLLDTPFNQCKCAFKALEYMACGLPVVASPIGANADVVAHGSTGCLAADTAAWVQQLRTLIGSPEQRAAMGRKGRQRVLDTYTTTHAAGQFLDQVLIRAA